MLARPLHIITAGHRSAAEAIAHRPGPSEMVTERPFTVPKLAKMAPSRGMSRTISLLPPLLFIEPKQIFFWRQSEMG
jgi:hypothetical protein